MNSLEWSGFIPLPFEFKHRRPFCFWGIPYLSIDSGCITPVVFSNSFHCQSFGTERANQQSLQSTDRAPLLITCCLRDPRLYGLNVSVSSFPVNGSHPAPLMAAVTLFVVISLPAIPEDLLRCHTNKDPMEVCPVSREANFEPLSTRLQYGIRFLHPPLPASTSGYLTISLPIGRKYRLTKFRTTYT